MYRIDCDNCNASYVSQTRRKLKTGISEHKNQLNRHLDNYSVVTEHRLNMGHEFKWQNTKVLDKEKFYHKRSISEMINIKLQNNPINIMSHTDKLKPYFTLLETYKKT